MEGLSDKEINALLVGIYEGSITQYEIPTELYYSISDYLKSGLYEGFGGTLDDFIGAEKKLLAELRENIYMFSAAKSFKEIGEFKSLMFDEDGKLRDLKNYLKHGEQSYETWNDAWARTEIHTAKFQAQNARDWVKMGWVEVV